MQRRKGGDHAFHGAGAWRRRARCCGKKRQLVEAARGGALLGFELGEDEFRALDDGRRQPGELRHLDPVAAIGCPRHQLVQEHDLALPFLYPHRGIEQARQACRERGELVEVGGEQCAAAIALVQMLDRGPGDGKPVECCCAAADLIEDDERSLARLIEDRRGLHHLDHEGRAPARDVVGRPHAREQPINRADLRAPRRHEAAHLRHDRNERILAQISRLARHVRAGDEIYAPVRGRRRRREVAVVGHEGGGVTRERLLHHGMASALDDEIERSVDLRPHVMALDRQLCQGCGDVEHGQRLGRLLDRRCRRRHRGSERLERLQFDGKRAISCACDLGFELAQFGRGEADLSGERLAMDEGRVERRRHQAFAVLRRHIDEIAEHIVVADLQRTHRCHVCVARLQRGNHAAGFVA